MSDTLETTRDEDERIAEIRARREAITPGPWKLCHHLQSAEHDASCKCGFAGDIWGSDGEHVVCGMGPHCYGKNDPGLCPPRYDRPTELANAAFIANAPADVAFLLAQLDEARKDSARYRFMGQRFAAADFNYPQYEDYTVLIIALNGRASVSADLDTTIDAAMAAAAWPSIEYRR